MAWANLEKGSEPSLEPTSWTARLAFLRTKRAISVIIGLGGVLIVAILLIGELRNPQCRVFSKGIG